MVFLCSQKTAYEMRISDWSSDVCSSDLTLGRLQAASNWVDLGRHFIEAPTPLYTWWSYRAKDWQASNRGRRLDHMWATPDLMTAAVSHRDRKRVVSGKRGAGRVALGGGRIRTTNSKRRKKVEDNK